MYNYNVCNYFSLLDFVFLLRLSWTVHTCLTMRFKVLCMLSNSFDAISVAVWFIQSRGLQLLWLHLLCASLAVQWCFPSFNPDVVICIHKLLISLCRVNAEVFDRSWTETEMSHNKRKWLPLAMRISFVIIILTASSRILQSYLI